jgi:hypothetical protein
MNTDDKIRAILRMEADTVEPSPAGWDAIQNGIAERRSRGWWTRGMVIASGLAVVVGVVVFVAAERAPRSINEIPSTASPGISTTPSASASPTPSAVVPPNEPIDAIWPLTTTDEVRAWQGDQERYPSLRNATSSALAFARNYVGLADAEIQALEGNYGENRFEVRNGDGVVVSTLTVKGFGKDGTAPFVVTLATSDAVRISTPVAGSSVWGTVQAEGTYEAVDPALDVTLRADAEAAAPVPLGTARAGTAEGNTWSASLTFTTSAKTGSLLVTNPSLKDGSVAAAAAVPLRFGVVTFPGPKAMVAARDGRIAVLSTATGSVVRWLTPVLPGGGASEPELSDDGKTVVYVQGTGTCSSEIRSVPVAGGKPTTLVGGGEGALSHPTRRGEALAYHRTECQEGGDNQLIVLRTPAGVDTVRVEGVLTGGPVMGERFVAYTVREGTASVLHTVDVYGELADNPVQAPAGCLWLSPAWGPRDATERDSLWVAATCSPRDEVIETRLYRFDQDARNRTLVATLDDLRGGVVSLDFAGEHLVIGTTAVKTDPMAWAYVGGTLRQIPGFALRPTWS